MRLLSWVACAACLAVAAAADAADATVAQRSIDPRCRPLSIGKDGPFVRDGDGALLVLEGPQLMESRDEGATWRPRGSRIPAQIQLEHVGHVGQFLRTREGVLVAVFLNFDGYKFAWNDELNAPEPDCRLELWAVRSTDGGQTWSDAQQLLPGYNADFMGFIQTRSGDLVATVHHLDPDLKRWISCAFVSSDLGVSWSQSNWIDLGGRGHHDGALEPTVVELRDGRLMMLIRTNLDRFWRAYSSDGGRSWRTIEPTDIDASSAPAWLARLASGRLVLAWNRSDSERKGAWPRNERGASFSAVAASWHREELAVAFSEDDGASWSKPQVVAAEDDGALAYPYLFERAPGELWLFSRFPRKSQPPLAVEFHERDFAP
jgi:hypothetical protein